MTTGQIYWGAVPFVVLQVIMVTLVIAFPQMVLVYQGAGPTVDASQVEIVLPPVEAPAAPPPNHDGEALGAGTPGFYPPRDTDSGLAPSQAPDDLTDLFK